MQPVRGTALAAAAMGERVPGIGLGLARVEVGGREVGFVQYIAEEPHLTSGSVEVLPEAEWQVEVVTEFGQAVAGEVQLVVFKELERC
ncbi:hypothetical protein [Streptomyces erythrochromogenes]|uniref:hypothetical protein n=1 Tax=Streptomyces erythrochromogenes TaxID=285574 RepID=UPI003865802C|nr:hypothetical protein OG489_19060 [Streptomyces erythrochromogenes]